MKTTNIKKTALFYILISILASLTIEVLIFNRHAILSIDNKDEIGFEYNLSDEFMQGEWCKLDGNQTVSINIENIDTNINYLMVDVDCIDEGSYYNGKSIPLNVYVSISDEGNSIPYKLPCHTLYSDIESTKYIRIYSYGKVKSIQIDFDRYEYQPYFDMDTYVCINKVVGNARVPFQLNFSRLTIYWLISLLLICIRPKSYLYKKEFTSKQKKIITFIIIFVNIICWFHFLSYGRAFGIFREHSSFQYPRLAVSLLNGSTNISVKSEELLGMLKEVSNPYDTQLRRQELGIDLAAKCWDLAYYNGNLYSYFGIVPVILFYIPFYLLTGYDFPACIGVFIMGAMVITGAFYLLHQIIKKFFKDIPFIMYLVLSVIIANSIGVLPFMMRPDFYALPIISAIAFTLWGLGLWISAAHIWNNQQEDAKKHYLKARIFTGSLCMALVAGCRPQFLLGSFLVFFIFGECFKFEMSKNKKNLILNIIIGILPYILVASGLMYYNYIRFDSPFDFGANYNLTTNDMTHRGFNLGRIPDGIFMYLLQLPNVSITYPYINETGFMSSYIGKTIREPMFGGLLLINPIIIFGLLSLKYSKDRLKEKKLYKTVIMMFSFAVIIAIVDTQMAGILARYYGDFAWLFILATVIIILQLYENVEKHNKNNVIQVVIVLGVCSIIIWFFIGINMSLCIDNDVAKCYNVRNYFIN